MLSANRKQSTETNQDDPHLRCRNGFWSLHTAVGLAETVEASRGLLSSLPSVPQSTGRLSVNLECSPRDSTGRPSSQQPTGRRHYDSERTRGDRDSFTAWSRNTVQFLIDDIQTSGDDLTYAAFKSELREAVAAALRGVVENHCGKECPRRLSSRVDVPNCRIPLRLGIKRPDRIRGKRVIATNREPRNTDGVARGRAVDLDSRKRIRCVRPGLLPVRSQCGRLDNMGDDGETGGILCYCCPPDDFNSDDESARRIPHCGRNRTGGKRTKSSQKQPNSDDSDDNRGDRLLSKCAPEFPGR